MQYVSHKRSLSVLMYSTYEDGSTMNQNCC